MFGGYGEIIDELATMEMYDPVADKWTKLKRMPKTKGKSAIWG